MVRKLWLHPPLAIARLGPSDIPCDNYSWGPNDVRPRGTGKTSLTPEETLDVDRESGTITSRTPDRVVFKDAVGFRPVCPFFELHGEWTLDGATHKGPVTATVLELLGLQPGAVRWTITVANLKPFHYTLSDDDRISASLQIAGDDTGRHELRGASPPGADRPLVPNGQMLPLGLVQVTQLTPEFPECRLRFTPPRGLIYGPTNFNERVAGIVERGAPEGQPSRWVDEKTGAALKLPEDRLILNPEARWSRWSPFAEAGVAADFRTNPSELFAFDDSNGSLTSLGLVDDVSDGVISCAVNELEAVARIVVGPPDYAPDRRPFVSLADGLTDRVGRDKVLDPAYVEEDELTALEIHDLLERVFETQGLMNLDAQNDRAHRTNRNIALGMGLHSDAADGKAFPRMPPVVGRPLPLTELGRQRHRRFLSLEVFEDRLREERTLLDRWIRPPMTGERYYDQKMPALMRGSDAQPMHLTRRQYDLIKAWVKRIRRDLEDA